MILKKYFIYIFPLIFSLAIILLSQNIDLWINIFRYFNIPPQIPPFSDLDAISNALKSKMANFNPYIYNPYDINNRVYIYPSFWLYFFDFLNLDLPRNFQIFCFIVIYLYSFIFLKISSNVYEIRNKILFYLTFFSSSNLLVLERLNIEVIIFIFIYFLVTVRNNYIKLSIFLMALYAKLYPVFVIFIFVREKIVFFTLILISLTIFYIIREEIFFLLNSGIEYALLASHGIPSLTKGFWYYSTKYNLFINDNNYLYFKYFLIFLGALYAFILINLNFNFGNKIIEKKNSIHENLFICGAGIYIGRFLFFGNFDYALIFLMFTIPYFFKLQNSKIKFFYIIIVIICLNSLHFEGGDRYTFVYFFKSSIFHIMKIIIFSINCYYLGKVLNRYCKI